MKRIHITLNDKVADRLNAEAKKVNKSRSAIIEEVITSWLSGSNGGSNRGLNQPTDAGFDENLKLRVADLEASLGWLQGEYSKMSDSMVQRALPRESVFSRLKAWWHTRNE